MKKKYVVSLFYFYAFLNLGQTKSKLFSIIIFYLKVKEI